MNPLKNEWVFHIDEDTYIRFSDKGNGSIQFSYEVEGYDFPTWGSFDIPRDRLFELALFILNKSKTH